MARLTPSGVLKLPNLAELDFKLREKENQDRLRADEYASKFQEIQGNFLPSDFEAVQASYDPIEEIIDQLGENPNDPNLRRKLREAYSKHSQIAGTAKFLADNNRKQRADYLSNPDNFGVTFQSFQELAETDSLVKRSADDILATAREPLTIPLAYKADMADPSKLLKVLGDNFKTSIKDYVKAPVAGVEGSGGEIDQELVEKKAREIIKARVMQPDDVLKAQVFQAYKDGLIGNPELKNPITRPDWDLVASEQFQKDHPDLLQKFTDSVVSMHLSEIPQLGIDAYTRSKDEEKARIARAKQQKDNVYFGLTPSPYRTVLQTKKDGVKTREETSSGYLYDIGGKDQTVKMSSGEDVLQYGVLIKKDGSVVNTVTVKSAKPEVQKDDQGSPIIDPLKNIPFLKFNTETRAMSKSEYSALKQKIPNFEKYMDAVTPSKENTKGIDEGVLNETFENIESGNVAVGDDFITYPPEKPLPPFIQKVIIDGETRYSFKDEDVKTIPEGKTYLETENPKSNEGEGQNDESSSEEQKEELSELDSLLGSLDGTIKAPTESSENNTDNNDSTNFLSINDMLDNILERNKRRLEELREIKNKSKKELKEEEEIKKYISDINKKNSSNQIS